MKKPLILLSGGQARDRHFLSDSLTLNKTYTAAVTAAGGLPVMALSPAEIGEYAALCDGCICSGAQIFTPEYSLITRVDNQERNLCEQQVARAFLTAGKPLLGICLGMQLLFDEGEEFGYHKGLGLIPGEVCPISGHIPEGYKIPHIGWNALTFPQQSPLFKYISEGDHVYFVHSYHAENCDSSTIATTEYGGILTAAVAKGNVFGCQFHPEKSGTVGLNILRAFSEMEG